MPFLLFMLSLCVCSITLESNLCKPLIASSSFNISFPTLTQTQNTHTGNLTSLAGFTLGPHLGPPRPLLAHKG